MLILMQGCPGSGKSTSARLFQQQTQNVVICSTDDFFYVEGDYVFSPDSLSYYHALNQFEVDYWLSQGRTVIVDNCNILQVHVDPYLQLAKKYGIPVRVWRCAGNFQSVHNVPEAIVTKMRQVMQDLVCS